MVAAALLPAGLQLLMVHMTDMLAVQCCTHRGDGAHHHV